MCLAQPNGLQRVGTSAMDRLPLPMRHTAGEVMARITGAPGVNAREGVLQRQILDKSAGGEASEAGSEGRFAKFGACLKRKLTLRCRRIRCLAIGGVFGQPHR